MDIEASHTIGNSVNVTATAKSISYSRRVYHE